MGRSDDKQSGRGRGDHAGFYRTLGLEPGATAAQIKAAYRSLAMELHPDRNPGRDTKARFQALSHAYAILSAEKKREQYDADSVVREAQGAASESMSGAPPIYTPICCSRCQAVSAQPRYRVFYTVYGWLWGADRKASQGVFCGRCEFRVGVRATATSLITGWWSLTGPSRTCQAVYANFRGGDFEYQNARLMGCQSMYFAHTGKIELALAVAAQAMDLVRSAPADSAENSVRNSPGNSPGNSADNLTGLAQSLKDLMDAYAGRSKRTFLKTYRSWSDRRIAAQGLIAACFALFVASGLGLMFSTYGAADLNAHQTQDPTHSPPRALTFQAPGFILPPSGVFRPVDPNPSGANSSFAIEQSANQASLNIALKLVNPVGSHKWLKLLRASDESEILGLFIRSGDTVEVAVPPGAYRAKVASGQTWQGEEARFGPKTQYVTSSAPLQLGIDRERSKSIVVDLAPANVSTKPGDRLFNELDPASF
jgi:hypothetical protein